MARFVVEATVVIKWFVPETHSDPAARLLDGGNDLFAADTLFSDAALIAAAKCRQGELTVDEAAQVIQAIESVPVRLQASQPLLEPALRIASAFDLIFRDCVGLVLAIQNECRLVTANRTLYDRVQDTPFARHVKWVGDLR